MLGRYHRPLTGEGDRDGAVLVRPSDLRAHPIELAQRVGIRVTVRIRPSENGVSPPPPRDVGPVRHGLSYVSKRPYLPPGAGLRFDESEHV